ncbi:MAG TPA: methionyl-tRNA formyltransferase [Porticoccaceae bacterium]|nr:methionyl-tRNA formyltransferase [Porticoccaceae bacterium]
MAGVAGLKLVFAGTPDFAAHHLEVLLGQSRHQVVGVYTQPDRPAGRGKKLQPSPVKTLATAHDIPVHQPPTLKTEAEQKVLVDLKADIMVVVAYGLILPPRVLAIPPLGCINVHASLLPRWRGAAPIQRAIEAGDSESGVTIMEMEAGLDTGPVLYHSSCAIETTDTAGTLEERLSGLGPRALMTVLNHLADTGQPPACEPQNESLATYAHKITKQEAWLDWRLSAEVLARRVRAFNPAPVAHTRVEGQNLRVWQTQALDREHQALPGTVLVSDEQGILVACGQGALLLTELQLAGKRRVPVADLLRGHAALFAPGAHLGE